MSFFFNLFFYILPLPLFPNLKCPKLIHIYQNNGSPLNCTTLSPTSHQTTGQVCTHTMEEDTSGTAQQGSLHAPDIGGGQQSLTLVTISLFRAHINHNSQKLTPVVGEVQLPLGETARLWRPSVSSGVLVNLNPSWCFAAKLLATVSCGQPRLKPETTGPSMHSCIVT